MNKQQIKAKFFGAHIGCEVITDVFHKNESPVFLESIGLYSNGTPFFSVRLTGAVVSGCSFNERHSKLVLRHISLLTKKEAILMAEMIGSKKEWGFIYQMFRHKKSIRNTLSWISCRLDAADYLRSINICLPFCGYDPIAEGWAILEEKIPANEAQKNP